MELQGCFIFWFFLQKACLKFCEKLVLNFNGKFFFNIQSSEINSWRIIKTLRKWTTGKILIFRYIFPETKKSFDDALTRIYQKNTNCYRKWHKLWRILPIPKLPQTWCEHYVNGLLTNFLLHAFGLPNTNSFFSISLKFLFPFHVI